MHDVFVISSMTASDESNVYNIHAILLSSDEAFSRLLAGAAIAEMCAGDVTFREEVTAKGDRLGYPAIASLNQAINIAIEARKGRLSIEGFDAAAPIYLARGARTALEQVKE